MGIGIDSFHMCRIMLLFSDMLYMLVRYESPSCPIYLRCLRLTLSGHMELLFLLGLLPLGLVLW